MADQWEAAAKEYRAKNQLGDTPAATVSPSGAADDPWGKVAHEYAQQQGPRILAAPRPAGMLAGAEQFMNDAAEDVRHGTTLTPIGRGLHAMGAQGTSEGNSEKVGDFMASPMLGPLRAAKGLMQIPQGKVVEGGKNLAGGAMDAATIPAAMSFGPDINGAMEVAPRLAGATGRALVGGGRAAAAQVRPFLSGFSLKNPLKTIPDAYDAIANTYRGARAAVRDMPEIPGEQSGSIKQQALKFTPRSEPKTMSFGRPKITPSDDSPLTPQPAPVEIPGGQEKINPRLRQKLNIGSAPTRGPIFSSTASPRLTGMPGPSWDTGESLPSPMMSAPQAPAPKMSSENPNLSWDPMRGHVDVRTGKAPISSVELPVSDAQRIVDTLGDPNRHYGKYAMKPNSDAQIGRNAAALREAAERNRRGNSNGQ